jgi:hypothetical protein
MSKYIRQPRSSMLVSALALVALAACGDKAADNSALTSDSALGRDLAMAQKDSVQPQLQDVPATPPPAAAPSTPAPRPRTTAPRTTTPRPTTTAPAPSTTPKPAAPAMPVNGTVAAGTSMRFATNNKVCSNTASVGEKFTASLTQPVSATNGITVPDGATGTFEVVESKTAKNSNDNTVLRVKLLSITYGGNTYPVDATVQTASTERVRSATKSDDAKKVAGGAIIGAIAGQVIGKNTKGTVIGAAAGAAAGTAAAAATANYDTCINSGGAVTVTLDGPITVRALPTP